ncbi:MAG: DUF4430 domain-containing protein [Patescibacteria group bacterium]
MKSWNRRFFLPSLLLSCIVISGAVLAQPTSQTIEEETTVVFLPETADRLAALTILEKIEPTVEATPQESNQPEPLPTSPAPTTKSAAVPTETTPATITVTLVIQGPGISTSGKLSLEDGATVYQVLKQGSKQLDFSLKTSHHSSLGIFVEGIAGVMNNPKANAYWLYYVNGQFASRGVSLQTVQEGDTITWSYE